jgi:hypothetical protein
MGRVARQVIQPGEASLVTHRLHGLGDASNPKTGRSERTFSRAAAPLHVFASEP